MAQPLITPPPDLREVETPPDRKSGRKTAIWIIVIFIVLALGLLGIRALHKAPDQSSARGQGRGAGGADASRAIPVSVAPVQQRDIPVYLEGLGNVQAYYTVTIHSRVDGQLMQVHFREGQHIRQGDELALIDPRPYEVQVAQAEATKYKDQANLENAQRDLQRYADLYKQGVIAQQQYNTQQSVAAGGSREHGPCFRSKRLDRNYSTAADFRPVYVARGQPADGNPAHERWPAARSPSLEPRRYAADCRRPPGDNR